MFTRYVSYKKEEKCIHEYDNVDIWLKITGAYFSEESDEYRVKLEISNSDKVQLIKQLCELSKIEPRLPLDPEDENFDEKHKFKIISSSQDGFERVNVYYFDTIVRRMAFWNRPKDLKRPLRLKMF